MTLTSLKISVLSLCMIGLAACSGPNVKPTPESVYTKTKGSAARAKNQGSLFDAFKGKKNAIRVNRFLWSASLDVLDFLPVQSADPFTGVISTGYGTPPGGGQAYRATILISDPALDARSLNVALQTRGGRSVSTATQRAVEDAILSRARQMRIAAGRF